MSTLKVMFHVCDGHESFKKSQFLHKTFIKSDKCEMSIDFKNNLKFWEIISTFAQCPFVNQKS